jgi:hypothetical protein
MTSPDESDLVLVPAEQARRILVLLGTCEQVISALRARGQRRGLAPADLEQLAGLIAGVSSADLAARLDAAQRELAAAAVLAGEAR